MSESSQKSRRSFLKKAVGTAIVAGAAPHILSAKPASGKRFILEQPVIEPKSYSANDQINIAVIGVGIMGFNNAASAVKVPGVKLVGACDLYTGRLDHAKELYGKDLFTTKDYREILNRKDIDAVIIATSDHWHDHISIDAMNAGKHVYCEKPMVHHLDEGAAVIAAEKKTGKVFQVGSQWASSIVSLKAKEIFESGVIGQLVLAETWNDRHSAEGAWEYSIPTDAKDGTVDWDTFLGDAPKVAYDPVRFFRWRNYRDYGTGMAGDLFVHLFTALHTVTSSKGPNRIYGTGGLRYWKDGRDVPDILASLHDYPEATAHPAFNLQMRVNFNDGSGGGGGHRLVGTEGAITLTGGSVKVSFDKLPKAPGYGGWDSFGTFTEAQQKEYEAWYRAQYPPEPPGMIQPDVEYHVPKDWDSDVAHKLSFFNGIRQHAPIREDSLFGMRAAGPALCVNKSYFDKKVINWNPETATEVA